MEQIVTENATERADLPHPYVAATGGVCGVCGRNSDVKMHQLVVTEAAYAPTVVTEKGV